VFLGLVSGTTSVLPKTPQESNGASQAAEKRRTNGRIEKETPPSGAEAHRFCWLYVRAEARILQNQVLNGVFPQPVEARLILWSLMYGLKPVPFKIER
jgi:hypothetical protein